MKFAIFLAILTLAIAAPPSDDELLVITEKFYLEDLVIYTAEHDIVDISVNSVEINYSEDKDKDAANITLFFVEADIKENGEKEYKGVYVYKNGVAKKVLDNGQCSTDVKNGTIYFGASDGIYKYNEEHQTATKYGTVSDNIISFAADTEHAKVYYITSDNVLYKFDEDEKVATKVEAVKDARDMVIDYDGIMFYYDGSNQLYTYNGERVDKMEGLPAHPSKVELIRPPLLINQVFAVIDDRLYSLNANSTSEKMSVKFQAQPTAFAPDALLVHFYAYKQKLYMYDMISLMNDKKIEGMITFFEKHEDQINAFKTRKISRKL